MIVVLVLFLIVGAPVFGVDFPDPFDVIDPGDFPGKGTDSGVFLPFMAGSFSYDHAVVLHSADELFQIRTNAYGTLLDIDRLGVGYRFDALLLAGPVDSSESAASVAEFWLNAVQYEYGFHASYRVGENWTLLGEYSRLSLHPLRRGFGQTAYDIVKFGLAAPVLEWGAGRMESNLRFGYHSLFRFWESELSQYRVRYSVAPRMRLTGLWETPFYLDSEAAVLVLREGGIGYEIYAEGGRSFSLTGGGFELYLWLRFNDDAELQEDSTEGSRQIGLGMRLTS